MIGAEAASEEPIVRLRVAIRADASLRIGAGHVMRCLALANALRAGGHEVHFIMREAAGDLRELVADSHAFRVMTLRAATATDPGVTDERADAHETLAALDDLRIDWMVVDHYELGAPWETRVAATGPHVLAIDDFASRDHACTLLVDHNLVQPAVYTVRTAACTDLLLGPRFALLRPEFTPVSSDAAIPETPRTIIVSFGGSDPTRQTTKVLSALRGIHFSPERVVAVAGRDHPDLDRLRAMAAAWPELEVHEFVENPEALLRTADLAIGAGGVSALERLAIGVPSIVLATAGNQERPAEALARDGAFLYLGRAASTDVDALTAAIDIMVNRHLREAMRRRSTALLDGLGPTRIVRAMWQRTPVTVRRADDHDRSRIYAWRNHPAVRATAFDPSEIAWATHDRWFDGVLADPARHLLVAEHRGTPLGVVRYDLDRANATAELSIFLAPQVLGLGLGKPVLIAANAWLTTNEPAISRIEAHVQGTNQRSRRFFESAGFRVRRTTLELDRTARPAEPHGDPLHGGS